MAITKLPSGQYMLDIKYSRGSEHRRFQKCVGTFDREARRAESIIRGKIAVGDFSFDEQTYVPLGFSAVADKYLKLRSELKKSHRSLLRDRSLFGILKKRFGNCSLDSIWQVDLERFFAERKENGGRKNTGVTDATLNRDLGTIKNFFSVCVTWKHLQSNPASAISKWKLADPAERYLEVDEATIVLDECRKSRNHDLYDMVLTALYTGLRKGEVLELRWDQISFRDRFLTVVQPKTGFKKVVPLPAEVIHCLRSRQNRLRLAGQGESPYVFRNGSGKPYTHVRRSLATVLKRAGITRPFSFKDLRHTTATWLRMRGVDIADIQKILGHRRITTTMRYAHIGQDRFRDRILAVWASDGPVAAKERKLHSSASELTLLPDA